MTLRQLALPYWRVWGKTAVPHMPQELPMARGLQGPAHLCVVRDVALSKATRYRQSPAGCLLLYGLPTLPTAGGKLGNWARSINCAVIRTLRINKRLGLCCGESPITMSANRSSFRRRSPQGEGLPMGKHARSCQSRLGARVACTTTGGLAVALSAGVGSAAAATRSTDTPMTAAASFVDMAQAPYQAVALDAPPTPSRFTPTNNRAGWPAHHGRRHRRPG